ncbi:MAG: imidazole glycerol phosphate synthase subunit HisH [Rhizobiales bacterium]|nr:imidazole glycerol phosphate synthase subunit HisH [Hyphomicrobiales bacterium]
MKRSVTVIDIGIGNTHSVLRALEHVGANPALTRDPQNVLLAERVVFPGVGAFGDCATRAEALGMLQAVREFAELGRPLLGLCVGMQLLFDSSTEFGNHEGLGIMAGALDRIPAREVNGSPLRVPHIGWSDVRRVSGHSDVPLFRGLPEIFSSYFVHSYAVTSSQAPDCCAVVEYGGHQFVAAAQKNNVFGLQFHPEKSARFGLRILQNFIDF